MEKINNSINEDFEEKNIMNMSEEQKELIIDSISETQLHDGAKDFLIDAVSENQFENVQDFFELIRESDLPQSMSDDLMENLNERGFVRGVDEIEASQTQELTNQVKSTLKDIGQPDLLEQFKPSPKTPLPTPKPFN